jgi:hypothetical protein
MANEANVVVKNMYDVFGMRRQEKTIYLGDLRKDFTRSLLVSLEKIIEKRQRQDSYYLWVHSRFNEVDKNAVKTVVMVLPALPPKQLGTMCFYVDNRAGRFEKKWVLPLDRAQLHGLTGGPPVVGVNDDAKDMPVLGLVFK